MWQLPDDFQLVDQSQKEEESASEANIGDSQVEVTEIEEEEGMTLEMVEGFPEWRRVDRGDGMPYFFHVETQETRWDPPS
jgi:hypothetical protein